MNEFQVIQQAKFLAANNVWPGGTEPVFGGVTISIKSNEQLLEMFTLPLLVIRPGSGQSDPAKKENPRLIRQSMVMRILVDNKHDAEAEAAIIGAHRNPVDDSDGRGILEVQERLIDVLGQTTGRVAIKIIMNWRSLIAVDEETPVGQVAFRDYIFDALVANDRFYHPPTRLVAVDAAGAGDADLTWLLPPARFDFFRVELVRKAGTVPPVNPADGTSVFTTSTLEAFTDSPGAGPFAYSLFAQYDEDDDPPDSADINSVPDTATVVVT